MEGANGSTRRHFEDSAVTLRPASMGYTVIVSVVTENERGRGTDAVMGHCSVSEIMENGKRLSEDKSRRQEPSDADEK